MIANDVLEAMRLVVNEDASLHEPNLIGNEWLYIKDCLDTGWVSSVGSYVEKFGHMLSEVTNVSHAVPTINGTSALHVCLLLAGVRAGDEVIVPALSFVAVANAVSYCNAIPHFADSSESTLGLDPKKLSEHLADIGNFRDGDLVNKKTGRRIAAVVCMHAFGHPASLDEILTVCQDFELPLIEDAAESLGSYYKDSHTGKYGLLSALSFNGNKIITTGSGGAILTESAELAARAKHLTTTAKKPSPWEFDHDQIGYNYRLANINAAIGCAQLENLNIFIENKRNLAKRYEIAFQGLAGVKFFTEPKSCRSNYWLNLIILEDAFEKFRDEVLHLLNNSGLMSRPAWKPLSTLAPYNDCPQMDLSVSRSLYKRIINIPSSAQLGDA